MKTEKDLLSDIIFNVPDNSKWYISKNSTDEIPEIFKNFEFSSDVYDWIITIKSKYREEIIELIDEHELYEKLIRQSIINGQGETIMDSYDVMSFTTLDDSFPSKSELLDKYKDSEVCVE